MRHTTPTPPPNPADPRHWTPPLSFSGVGNPNNDGIGPESRHLMQTGGLSAVRCSAKMLQAEETLNQNPVAGLEEDDDGDDDDEAGNAADGSKKKKRVDVL